MLMTMRKVTFIVTTVFGVATAGWNHFQGHIEHHSGSLHFGPHHESVHFGNHESQHGPYYLDPHLKSPHYGSRNKHHHYRPPHESPHGTPPFSHPQQHQFGDYSPLHPPRPHYRPPWKRPDWDKPRLKVHHCNDDSSSSSSSSSSSEEDDDDYPEPYRNTQTVQLQRTTPTIYQTTTESRHVPNKPSFYRTTLNPWFTNPNIYFGVPNNPSTASNLPNVQACVTSCSKTMTPEYNPVCGTNNMTYQNIGSLLCAKGCGVDVEVKRTFPCPRDDAPTTREDTTHVTLPTVRGHTTDTTEPTSARELTMHTPQPTASGHNALSPKIHNCMQTCPFNGAFSPVCGTNLETYFNHDRFLCAKKCGVDVELLCRFPCATRYCHVLETTTTTATSTVLSRNVVKTTPPSPSPQQCMSTCNVTTEHNPICGTNNITYANPSKLHCAQLCGVDVGVKHVSTCSNYDGDTTSSLPPTAVTAASTPLSPFTVACMRGCGVTSEYNPVCGTNNVTYTNPGRLECAQICGVDVEIRIRLPCKIINPNDFTTVTDPPTSSDVTKPPSPTTASSATIDQSLLDNIFGRTTTTIHTLPTTTESDEVFQIDPRFNNL